jgi:hypothetical protein
MTSIQETKFIKWTSKGIVYGNYWGGGRGSYTAEKLEANTKEELLALANKMLDNGSLDAGMGYESLIGALLNITKITTIEIDGKHFVNKEYEMEFIGTLTEEEEDFLEEVNCYQS